MKYQLNLVAELRAREKAYKFRHFQGVTVLAIVIAVLLLVIIKWTFGLLSFKQDIENANNKLQLLKYEYQQYQATNLRITKEDVELLDKLQHSRVFWSKKLAALASPLPPNYWVDAMGYKSNELRVKGFGYIDTEQRQLLTLDYYLNILRVDSVFNKGMPQISLQETRRNDDQNGESKLQRVSFEYSAKAAK